MATVPSHVIILSAAILGIGGGAVWANMEGRQASAFAVPAQSFALCSSGPRSNCVVDGDTIWMDGFKIRVADIDAPEVSSPKCPYEAELAAKATRRLYELINAGPFEVQAIGSRDEDQYGRKLRVLIRDGRSIGDQLVHEGLARTWTGRWEPWC